MTIADLIKSVIDSSKERAKTPIGGAYVLSFVAFNWRPILYLLFSEAKIDCKIQVINIEYCFWGAILWPVLIAFIWTMVIPFSMTLIEACLDWPIRKRRENIYGHKEDDIDKQMALAVKEVTLQNIRANNQEKEDLLKQIDGLKDHANQTALSYDTQIKLLRDDNESLNSQLANLSEKNRAALAQLDYVIAKYENSETDPYLMVNNLITDSERRVLINTEFDFKSDFPTELFPATLIRLFESRGLLNVSGKFSKFTEEGVDLMLKFNQEHKPQ